MNEAEGPVGPTPDMPDTRETANRLRIATGAFRRRVQEATSTGELSNPQLTALSRLDRLGPMTTTGLARREQITPQAMGTTIASLERLGLVVRSDGEHGSRECLDGLILPVFAGQELGR